MKLEVTTYRFDLPQHKWTVEVSYPGTESSVVTVKAWDYNDCTETSKFSRSVTTEGYVGPSEAEGFVRTCATEFYMGEGVSA